MNGHTWGPCECKGDTPRDQSVLLSCTVAILMAAKIGPCWILKIAAGAPLVQGHEHHSTEPVPYKECMQKTCKQKVPQITFYPTCKCSHNLHAHRKQPAVRIESLFCLKPTVGFPWQTIRQPNPVSGSNCACTWSSGAFNLTGGWGAYPSFCQFFLSMMHVLTTYASKKMKNSVHRRIANTLAI